ncbi:hypothetical protein N665_1918s0002 [Sinapis alba]|nr:hypothetical protein N665_1918s0002 [Sinapis alba]
MEVRMRMRVLAALKLEKAIPFSHEMEIIQLKLHDQARYDRLLQSLDIQLTYFDPGSSVTTNPISCSGQRCSWGVHHSSNPGCSVQNYLCAYTFQYGDGSGTSGFCVSDVLQFDIRLIHMSLGKTCCLILDSVLCFSVFSSCIV